MLIGKVHFNELVVSKETPEEDVAVEALTQSIIDGIPVLVDPAYGFKSDAVMIQTQEGPGTTLLRQCMPLMNFVADGKVHTKITGGVLFSEMEKNDANRHKNLVDQLLQSLMKARMDAVGLAHPNQGAPTGGPPGQT